MFPLSRITSVKFNLTDKETILKNSVKKVTSGLIFKSNLPAPEGVYNPKLGTTSNSYNCATCGNDKKHCFGHWGHYELNYPVYSPLSYDEIIRWLRITCHHCGLPIYSDWKCNTFSILLEREVKDNKKPNYEMTCENCNKPHIHAEKSPNGVEDALIYAKIGESKEMKIIYPDEIFRIFDRIPDKVPEVLGGWSHPRNFILFYIPIPPNNIRPEVSIVGGGKSNTNSITSLLRFIIQTNEEKILNNVPDSNRELFNKNWNLLYNYVDGLIRKTATQTSNNLIKSNNTQFNSYAEGIAHKHGRIRENLLGKKIFNVCRSTIKCDPTIPPDEILIPMSFAQKISMPEYVQEFNREKLLVYINNSASGSYPMARTLIKANTGIKYAIDKINDRDSIIIENGDIIERDLIDGDIVMFNRQPSIKSSQITGTRVRISRDPNAYAIAMNVISCDFYEADFDGDEMNMYIPERVSARTELEYTSSAANFFISNTSSNPAIGQTNDSVVGAYLLTLNSKKFDRRQAMSLFANTNFVPRFDKTKKTFTGREIVSLLLSETPISYKGKPNFFNKTYAPYISYKDDEVNINIKAGKMISGTLDKTAVGGGKSSNIFHRIAREYGNVRAMQSLFDFQQVIIANNNIESFTISLADMILPEGANKEIARIITDIMKKAYLFTERLNRGEIVPPIGKTLPQYYEEQMVQILKIIDDFERPILQNMDIDKNCLLRLILTKSKGSINDMYNMVSSVGQKVINGERIREDFSYRRSLAYFRRFDPSPESRGYMFSNYLHGTTMTEFIFNAMSSRFDLIVKALNTAVTGEQHRNITKCLESLVSSNTYSTIQHTSYRLIQPLFGDDGLDTRFVESVKFNEIFMTDAEFAKSYFDKDGICNRVRKYVQNCLLYVNNIRGNSSVDGVIHLPINPEHVADEIIEKYSADAGDKKLSYEQIMDTLLLYKDQLPYAFINSIAQKAGRSVPESYKYATRFLEASIMFALFNKEEDRRMSPKILGLYLAEIKMQLIKSLVTAGTNVGVIAGTAVGSYLTQYMLDAHHRSATGGTSLNLMDKVGEILKAKPFEKIEGSNCTIIPVKNRDKKQEVQYLANNIKLMNLRQLVLSRQIFYEKFGKPVHPDFEHEEKFIKKFVDRALIKPPSGLIDWCIRYQLDKTSLIIKSITVPYIIARLTAKFSNLYFVNTDENSDEVVIRVYIRANQFKNEIGIQQIRELAEMIYDEPIRGIPKVLDTFTNKRIYSQLSDDGAIEDKTNEFVINTYGTNLGELFSITEINSGETYSDNVHEIENYLGIWACKKILVVELQKIVSGINTRHYLVYADELTWNGKFTGISPKGLIERNPNDVLLGMSYSGPISVLKKAAVNNQRESQVANMSSALMVGTIPKAGTTFVDLIPNKEVIKNNIKRADEYLDML